MTTLDVSCVINAHKEAHTIHPTIRSVIRAAEYARVCGLTVELHVILDSADQRTHNIVERALENIGTVHNVSFRDLSQSRNHAVNVCKGNYLSFIDGDDLWSLTWVVDCFLAAQETSGDVVFHPEYNVCFGNTNSHIFQHVDMHACDFEIESFLEANYWTALSFAKKTLYEQFPYQENKISEGFGYEDWTWNYQTIQAGVIHRVVKGTSHFIRKVKNGPSLLEATNTANAIPTILDLYRQKEEMDIKKRNLKNLCQNTASAS